MKKSFARLIDFIVTFTLVRESACNTKYSGERANIVKRGDNLQPEGEFQKRPDQTWAPGERANIVKRGDNLQPEGEFQKRPDQTWMPGMTGIEFYIGIFSSLFWIIPKV